MDGQADEFCVVEPLTLIEESANVESSGIAEAIETLKLAGSAAPNTPIPLPKPPSGNRDNGFANTEGWGISTVVAGASTTGGPCNGNGVQDINSPPWTPTDPVGDSGSDQFAPGLRAGLYNGVGPGMTESMLGSAMGTIANNGTVAADLASGAPGAVSTTPGRTPRRKRTSGINRQLGMGSRPGNAGPGGGGVGAGRRRGGPGNGKGGLSKKTLNIVTNLRSHTAPVRSQQELEEMEEEKRLAEEERRFKENLRQKGDDFDHTIRILLLGDSGVGKTSLMLRFSEDKFAPTMISTAGVDFKVQTLDIHGKRVRCQIWDTAGQEKFHVITRAYYRGAHGIALAYDLTDEDSFKNVNYWMANIQTHAEAAQRIQKMILGNKVDIEERAISTKDGQAVAKEFGVRFFEVSAKNGHGVSDAFYTLAVDIVQSLEAAQRRGSDDRRGSRIFGSARLRSLTSRRPTFGLTRTGISVGKVGVVIGSGGGLAKKTGSESAQEGTSSEEGVESLGGGVGDRYSTERCKVS